MNRRRDWSRQRRASLLVSSSRNLKTTLIILQILAASCLVHEALTAIGKDCGRIGKKALARIWRDQRPALIRPRCSDRSRDKQQRRTAMALKVEPNPTEGITSAHA